MTGLILVTSEYLSLEMVVTQHSHTTEGVLCSVPVQQFESAKVLGPISVVSYDAQNSTDQAAI